MEQEISLKKCIVSKRWTELELLGKKGIQRETVILKIKNKAKPQLRSIHEDNTNIYNPYKLYS